MYVIIPESAGIDLSLRGYFEPELTFSIYNLVKPSMTFIDIGAHYGYYSILASHLVGNKGRVHSFEPTPSTFEILKRNVSKSNNIIVNNVACFSETGSITFYDYGSRYSGFNSITTSRLKEAASRRSLTVRTCRLDDYIECMQLVPDFVKIDAESAEYEILKGMNKILTDFKPIVSLEVGDYVKGSVLSSQLVENVRRYGYDIFEIYNWKLRRHMVQDQYSYGNLIFIPQEKKNILPSPSGPS